MLVAGECMDASGDLEFPIGGVRHALLVDRHGHDEGTVLFRQAKNKVKARVVLGSERPQNRLFTVGGNWLQRREYRAVADDLKSLDDVTVESVRAVLGRYPLSRVTTITVGPRKDVRPPG